MSNNYCKLFDCLHKNHYVKYLLMFVLVLSILIPSFTKLASQFMSHTLIKLLILLLIVCLMQKDTTLGILLAFAYVILTHKYYAHSDDKVLNNQENLNVSVEMSELALDNNHNVNQETETFEQSIENNDDKIQGYTNDYNCLKNCSNLNNQNKLNKPCEGISTWSHELNAQGLNCPQGYGGNTLSTF